MPNKPNNNSTEKQKLCTYCKKNEVARFGLAGVDTEGSPVAFCADCSAKAVKQLTTNNRYYDKSKN